MMKCKFEHDDDCCNCASPQYMARCRPLLCGCVVPMTNADHIRAMSDEELAEAVAKYVYCGLCPLKNNCNTSEFQPCNKVVMEWLQQPAEESI